MSSAKLKITTQRLEVMKEGEKNSILLSLQERLLNEHPRDKCRKRKF
jgi:hypothetical protein